MISAQSMTPQISTLTQSDYEQWFTLWQGYLSFYKTSLSAETTTATWTKLLDSNVPIYGFGAYVDDKLIGFSHVVIHPNTWNTTDCCYLEDLFVDPLLRGKGVARLLIEQVYQFADSKDCNRVYWVTNEDNLPARKLYDTIADKTDMVQYRHNL